MKQEASAWVLATLKADPRPHTLGALSQQFAAGVELDAGVAKALVAHALTELAQAGTIAYVKAADIRKLGPEGSVQTMHPSLPDVPVPDLSGGYRLAMEAREQ